MKSYTDPKSGIRTAGPDAFIDGLQTICEEANRLETAWIATLRSQGVKAAHPDDGWVNREASKIILQYPQFNDGLSEGDTLALGWPEQYRLVRVTRRERGLMGLVYFHFEEAQG